MSLPVSFVVLHKIQYVHCFLQRYVWHWDQNLVYSKPKTESSCSKCTCPRKLWPKSIISHTFAGNFREFMGTHAGTSGLSGSTFPSSCLDSKCLHSGLLSYFPSCISACATTCMYQTVFQSANVLLNWTAYAQTAQITRVCISHHSNNANRLMFQCAPAIKY